MPNPHAEMRAALEGFIREQSGAEATVDRLEPLAGGASRESWRVDLTLSSDSGAETYALFMRRDLLSEMQPDALDRESEFRLLQMAHRAGVAVPLPRWLCCDAQVLERPFFLMDRVEGESIGARVVRRAELADARKRLPEQMAEQLAAIHRIGDVSFLPGPADGETPAAYAIRRLREHAKLIEITNPAYEFAFRWLEANAPKAGAVGLVHGDYRVGNVILDEDGLLAIVDWEFAHRGDPDEDLAWPCMRDWRFGQDQLTFGGVGMREDFLAAYEAAAGRTVKREAVRYWEILGNVRRAVGCLSQAHRHMHGGDTSVELASLGRRAAEMELEFLGLIEKADRSAAEKED